MINIQPIMEKIIVKPFSKSEKIGNIIVPELSADAPYYGEIVAIGEGDILDGKLIPLRVKVGDKVVWSKFAGTMLYHEGVEYMVIRQSDIIGCLTGSKNDLLTDWSEVNISEGAQNENK